MMSKQPRIAVVGAGLGGAAAAGLLQKVIRLEINDRG
ncbi:Uncharacterised protein [Serratia marcescens]|nr:Uncharacterised protein [Serratia marcescens]CAI2783720.1 Uncharacterised protein [Serratia marcescens]